MAKPYFILKQQKTGIAEFIQVTYTFKTKTTPNHF